MRDDSDLASDQCSAIVFYGIHADAKQVEGFYKEIVDLFAGLGFPPDRLGVNGPGFTGKLGLFARVDAKLRRAGFAEGPYFQLLSSTPSAVTVHDIFLKAHVAA